MFLNLEIIINCKLSIVNYQLLIVNTVTSGYIPNRAGMPVAANPGLTYICCSLLREFL